MWRFRITRPLLLIFLILDTTLLITFEILYFEHARINSSILLIVSIFVGANLAALWRDGVN